MQSGNTWTEERISKLRELWSQGKTASEISAALGGEISRNAVIGKVHRLKLSSRPSPIKQRAPEPTPVMKPAKLVGTATLLALSDRSCKWPVGDPLSPDFHFCGSSAVHGLPYCTSHAQVAYQPKRSRNSSPFGGSNH